MPERAIGVVGAGYVGLTTAACLAETGHQVSCVDTDMSKVDALRAGEVRIAEPELADIVRAQLHTGRLAFHAGYTALRGTRVVFVCVPTPMGAGGEADLSALDDVVERLPVDAGTVLAVKSTVPAGTVQRLDARVGGVDVVSNPEFLREGHAVHDFRHPDRIVVGADSSAAAEAVADCYASFDTPVTNTDPASAELAKYACNTFLAMKVSYVNVLAELCERVGADIRSVSGLMGMDGRIGPEFLSPGPGWGGSCLPKDTHALASSSAAAGLDFALVRDTLASNDAHRRWVLAKIRAAATGRHGGSLSGVRIGLLGLAFKSGTNDLRASPAVALAADLAAEGAELTGHDPAVPAAESTDTGAVQLVDDPYLACKEADAVVVLTEWSQFRSLDWHRLSRTVRRAVVVDTRNLLDPDTLAAAGFQHIGVGVPDQSREWTGAF